MAEYKLQLLVTTNSSLECLPTVVVTQCSGQAGSSRPSCIANYLHHYHPNWVMQRTDITSKKIYKLGAQETILRQLHWRSRRTAYQLNEWINGFDDFQCIKKNHVAEEQVSVTPDENQSLDL